MISFSPLLHTLLDKRTTCAALAKSTGISTATFARMKHGLPISTKNIDRICTALGCSVSDIMAFVPDEGGGQS